MSTHTKYKITRDISEIWWKPLIISGYSIEFFDNKNFNLGGIVQSNGAKVAVCISLENKKYYDDERCDMAIGSIKNNKFNLDLFNNVERSMLASGAVTKGAISCKLMFEASFGSAKDIVFNVTESSFKEIGCNVYGNREDYTGKLHSRMAFLRQIFLSRIGCGVEISSGYSVNEFLHKETEYISVNYCSICYYAQKDLIKKIQEDIEDLGCRRINFLKFV